VVAWFPLTPWGVKLHIRKVIDRQFAPQSIMISHRFRSRFRMAFDQHFASPPITFSHHPIIDWHSADHSGN
jgi:hypothetical protein